MGAPRVDAETPLSAHSGDISPVHNDEDQPEAVLQFPLPLLQHGGRRGDQDAFDLAPQQQFAGDQPRFNGLAKAGVVGDEQIDAGQAQGLAQRRHLIGVDLDAGPEGRLEQIGLRRRGAVPA